LNQKTDMICGVLNTVTSAMNCQGYVKISRCLENGHSLYIYSYFRIRAPWVLDAPDWRHL